MNFFINDAFAAAGAAQQPSTLLSLLPLVFIFVIFWFLIIRPQTKRAKQHRDMVEALHEGDEIVTNGGLLGHIVRLGDSFLTVELADGVRVKLQRHMVGAVLPKGTIRNAD